MSGQPVRGARASIFLVPDSKWAPEALAGLGYAYSSSVLPAANPLFGWPGAPTRPFLWPSGLVELPAPVYGIGPLRLPLFGGTYLRLAPASVVRMLARRAPGHAWLYAHPYDFDPDEERWVVPEVGALGSRLLWWGRSGMRSKVGALVAGAERPLAEVASSVAADATVFEPEAPRTRPPPSPVKTKWCMRCRLHRLLSGSTGLSSDAAATVWSILVSLTQGSLRNRHVGRWLHGHLADAARDRRTRCG